MAKSAGTKTKTKTKTKKVKTKGARPSSAAKKKVAKKKAVSKKATKKAASQKKGTAKIVKTKASSKKPAAKKAGLKKANLKKAASKTAKKSPSKAKLSAAKTSAPKTGLTAQLPRTGPVSATYLRPNGQAVPLAQRHAKPGRRARKSNLLQRARPMIGRSVQTSLLAQPNTNWLAADEAASDTALRDRILVCLLALEGRLAGRAPEQGAPEWPKIVSCYQQIWDWIAQAVTLKDGRPLSGLLFEALLADELAMLRENLTSPIFDARPFDQARSQLTQLCLAPQRPE